MAYFFPVAFHLNPPKSTLNKKTRLKMEAPACPRSIAHLLQEKRRLVSGKDGISTKVAVSMKEHPLNLKAMSPT